MHAENVWNADTWSKYHNEPNEIEGEEKRKGLKAEEKDNGQHRERDRVKPEFTVALVDAVIKVPPSGQTVLKYEINAETNSQIGECT